MSISNERERTEVNLPKFRWQKASWDYLGGCWARQVEPDEHLWDLTVSLPENTDPDPNLLKLNVIHDEGNNKIIYTVVYKVKDKNVFKLLTVNGRSSGDNEIRVFGVQIGNAIESAYEPSEIDKDSTVIAL